MSVNIRGAGFPAEGGFAMVFVEVSGFPVPGELFDSPRKESDFYSRLRESLSHLIVREAEVAPEEVVIRFPLDHLSHHEQIAVRICSDPSILSRLWRGDVFQAIHDAIHDLVSQSKKVAFFFSDLPQATLFPWS